MTTGHAVCAYMDVSAAAQYRVGEGQPRDCRSADLSSASTV